MELASLRISSRLSGDCVAPAQSGSGKEGGRFIQASAQGTDSPAAMGRAEGWFSRRPSPMACKRPSPSTAAPPSTTGLPRFRTTWFKPRESLNSSSRTRIRTASWCSLPTIRATRTGTAFTGNCLALRAAPRPRVSSARKWKRAGLRAPAARPGQAGQAEQATVVPAE